MPHTMLQVSYINTENYNRVVTVKVSQTMGSKTCDTYPMCYCFKLVVNLPYTKAFAAFGNKEVWMRMGLFAFWDEFSLPIKDSLS